MCFQENQILMQYDGCIIYQIGTGKKNLKPQFFFFNLFDAYYFRGFHMINFELHTEKKKKKKKKEKKKKWAIQLT